MKKIPLILIPFFLGEIIGGSVMLYFGMADLIGAYKSESWVPVTATITNSQSKTARDSEGNTYYEAFVTYDFEIEGNIYAGDRIQFGPIVSGSYADVENIIRKYKKGDSITVYADPENNSNSVIIPGLNKELWIFPLMGAFVFVVCIPLTYLVGIIINNRKANKAVERNAEPLRSQHPSH